MLHPFQQLLVNHIHLTQKEWHSIESHLEKVQWNKGELLPISEEDKGDLFFLVSGLLRYYDVESEQEHTFLFADAPHIFISGQQIKKGQFIQALEKCTAWKLPKESLLKMTFTVENWDLFLRKVLNDNRKFQTRLHDAARSRSAEDWYKSMLTNCDPILARIPVKYLASYLGIAPVSLGKIRKKLMSEMSLSRYITSSF